MQGSSQDRVYDRVRSIDWVFFRVCKMVFWYGKVDAVTIALTNGIHSRRSSLAAPELAKDSAAVSAAETRAEARAGAVMAAAEGEAAGARARVYASPRRANTPDSPRLQMPVPGRLDQLHRIHRNCSKSVLDR